MKTLKCIFCAMIFCFIVLCMTGCGQDEISSPSALIILTGKHANSQNLDIELTGTIQEIYSSFGNVGIIVVDGNPEPLYGKDSTYFLGCYSIDYINNAKKTCKKNDFIWERDYLNPQIKDVTDALSACQADDPEVNTLEAIHSAVEMLNTIENSMGTKITKKIIILDTGLCTEGAINFQKQEFLELLSYEKILWENDVMKSKVDRLMDDLDALSEIPDLEGISITWYGLGEVSEPQEALSKAEKQNLQYIWGELLTRAGARPSDEINIDKKYGVFASTSAHGSITSKQYVTPIEWDKDQTEIPIKQELPELEVNFLPNTDNLLFPEKIEDVLSPYIKAFHDGVREEILLVGKTSSWNGGSLELSQKRAEKIKKAMIERGVPEEYIRVIGVGYNSDFCVNDSPYGEFEEEIAKKNRSVIILPYDSPTAQNILLKCS